MAAASDVTPAKLEATDDGRRIVSLVFGMAFYTDVPISKVGAGVLKIFDKFLAIAGKKTLSFYIGESMNKHKPVTDRALAMLPTWLKPGAPARESVGITYQTSDVFNAAPTWMFAVYGDEYSDGRPPDEAGLVRLNFPVEHGLERYEEMYKLFLELCGMATFRSGHAGFNFLRTRYGESDATEHAWAKSMRHPGIDIQDPINEELTIGVDSIMAINWLTFVDGRFVKQLGGAETVEKAAKKGKVTVQPQSGGLVLRAGARPRFGDVNKGDDLPEYKAVYRMLEPLMQPAFPRARSLSVKSNEEQRTLDWIQRHGR